MIEINLLPKDYLKKSLSFSIGKSGMLGVAAAAGIVIMLVCVSFYQMYQIEALDKNIEKANQRASMLQKDIQIVDALSAVKIKITTRMQAVDKLDSHRSAWVRILEDFAGNVPDFLWVTQFQEGLLKGKPIQNSAALAKKANQEEGATVIVPGSASASNISPIEIEGYCFSLNALATYMINVMRSDYFDNVELVSSEEKYLDADKKYRAYQFKLSCDLHYLSDENLRQLIAHTGESNKITGKSGTSHKVLN